LKALADDIVDAHIYYDLREGLIEAMKRYPLIAQQSNIFWTFPLQAHVNTSVFALFRGYDQDTRALHLRSWLKTIQENLHLSDETSFRERLKDNPYVASLAQDLQKPDTKELVDDIAACSSSDPIVKKLAICRNNRIVHRNAKALVASKISNELCALTFDDLRILLERAKTVLNRYSYLFSANVYSTKAVGRDDYNHIFKCVQDQLEVAMRKCTPEA